MLVLAAGVSHSLRLVGGDQPNEGVIQVYDGVSEWGYICCDSFSRHATTADAICRYFGYELSTKSYCDSRSVTDEASVFISLITCPTFDENGELVSTLEQCTSRFWHGHTCATGKHAAVECLQGICNLNKHIFETKPIQKPKIYLKVQLAI